jgi:glycosyltransferase involved in cell wall biosynthesis
VVRLRILSVSTVYPNPREPGAGLFVRSRLQQLGSFADLQLVAPIRLFDPAGNAFVPATRQDENILVRHPRWLYIRGAGLFGLIFLSLSVLIDALRIRKGFPFQVIDAHFGYPEAVAVAVVARCVRRPLVVTLRGSEVEHAGIGIRGHAIRWMLRGASRVITVSERLRKFAISMGAAESKVVTIPNGVNATIFFARDRKECRTLFGISEQRKLILTAGHLIELKGHHHIIRAIRRLLDRSQDVELWIAGGAGRRGGNEEALRRLVGELDLDERVKFLGQVKPESMAEMMCAADVFCLASSREGWPNVVHEALSCGTPVVATAVGAVPELIPRAELGMVVPYESVERLEEPLARALEARWDRAAIAEWGRARSWEEVAREVLVQMESVLKEAAR